MRTVTVPLTAHDYECCELVVDGAPEDLDVVYGLDYDEFPVQSYDRDGLTINLSTEGNRVWAEYFVCRAEGIATWDICPRRERQHYRSLAKKIQGALESVGLECRHRKLQEISMRWWKGTEPRSLTNLTVGGLT